MIEIIVCIAFLLFVAFGFGLSYYAGRIFGWEEGYSEAYRRYLMESKDFDDGK